MQVKCQLHATMTHPELTAAWSLKCMILTFCLKCATFMNDALVPFFKLSHRFLLQLTNRELQFKYSCGNTSPGSLLLGSSPVSDGQWHSVLLEVNSTALRLTLDNQQSAFTALTKPCRMMHDHGALLFASNSFPEDQQHLPNFTGCLKGLELNEKPIRVGFVGEWTGPGTRRVFGVYQCCSKTGACDINPCQNGGVCQEDSSGGEYTEV